MVAFCPNLAKAQAGFWSEDHKALYFKGFNNIRYWRNAGLSPTTGLTLEAWIYPTDRYMDEAGVITCLQAVGQNVGGGYGLFITGNQLIFRIVTNDGLQELKAFNAINFDTWQHVMATYDGSTGLLQLYVNGEAKGNRGVGRSRDVG